MRVVYCFMRVYSMKMVHSVTYLRYLGRSVAIMIHRIFVPIIVVVVSCCKICVAFVIKSYLPSTNSLQKKHPSNYANNNIKHSSSSLSSKLNVVNNNRGIELSNVFYDDTDMAFSAWEWQNGLGIICVDIKVHQLQL